MDLGRGTGWHRDFGNDLHHGSAIPSHLYLLFCLDDLTEANGGTWILPGSHRRCVQPEPPIEAEGMPPAAVRITAQAGDIVVLDPATLHASGLNRGDASRRLMSVALCHGRVSPACDHWRHLSPPLRTRCTGETRRLLQHRWDQDHAAWSALPDGTVVHDASGNHDAR